MRGRLQKKTGTLEKSWGERKECDGLEASENHYKSLQMADSYGHKGNFNLGAVLAFDSGI
jgi:hypothetical protein